MYIEITYNQWLSRLYIKWGLKTLQDFQFFSKLFNRLIKKY